MDVWDHRATGHADYQREFRELGIDIDGAAIEDTAERIRALPIRDQFSTALDDWAQLRQNLVSEKNARRLDKPSAWWRRPLVVARAVDADEFRNRVRLAAEQGDTATMLTLAEATEAAHLPASTLDLMTTQM